MKKLIPLLLFISFAASATIIPSERSSSPVEDELFSYQWALFNQEQTYVLEKDDIHNIPLKGIIGKDVGWQGLLPKLSQNRVLVAVLDSGVDLNHPELKDNLWKNDKECGKDPKVDNDGNKLPGDCDGWNFTAALSSDEAKDPTDQEGHGTHVSGIIAAAKNGEGIVGITPNAMILPVKVLGDTSNSDVANSDAFARGIVYAVDQGAQIINMSLGWPRSLETKTLREAVSYALQKGVIIVAAAGNNNSSEPLFPCAYDGVVCVAASTLDGTFAGFSNYGGHVDVVAPGEGILSLNPTFLEPEIFSVTGYELRSGTSQAAPMVSGLLASVFALEGKLTSDEVFGRLYAAELNSDSKKYINGGNATWSALSTKVNSPVVRPILKRVRQLVVRGDLSVSRFVLPIKNYGLDSDQIMIRVESLTPSIQINNSSQVVKGLASGEITEIPFDVSVVDANGESSVKLKITLVDSMGERSFYNEIPVARDIVNESSFKSMPFAFADKPLPVGGVRNGDILTALSPVESYTISSKHEYTLRRTLKNDSKSSTEITLIRRVNDKFVEVPRKILTENGLTTVNFIRVDLNLDGKEDYLVHTLAQEGDKKYFNFSFYDENLNPLWSSFQNVKLELDVVIKSMNNLVFIRKDNTPLGRVMLPAFFTQGALPEVDQTVTSWQRFDRTIKDRLYYLNIEEGQFKIHALTTKTWEEELKTELKTKWFDTVMVEQLLTVSTEDAQKGVLRILVSVGTGTKRDLYIHTVEPTNIKHGLKIPQIVIQSDNIDPVLAVTSKGLASVGDVFLNIYDRTRGKIVLTKNSSQDSELVYRHSSETDILAGHLFTFDSEGHKTSVLQSREKLITVNHKTNKVSERPKLRYSFLTQKLLSELYMPVIYNRDHKQAPALFVDSTTITGNRVYLFEENNGALVMSVRNSILVPSNCKSLSPRYNSDIESHEFVFICLENREWMIRTLPME